MNKRSQAIIDSGEGPGGQLLRTSTPSRTDLCVPPTSLPQTEARLGETASIPTIDAAVGPRPACAFLGRTAIWALDARNEDCGRPCAVGHAACRGAAGLHGPARRPASVGQKDKVIKNRLVTTKTPGPEDLEPASHHGGPRDDGD